VDKKQKTTGETKRLIEKQLKNREFKEAMQSSFAVAPNDDEFEKFLKRLEEAEQKKR